tara:strand:- start:2519 stop:2773 length:255 start_codon:yes stop_codon:yes gene_type:complete
METEITTTATEPIMRYRINTSTSVKGIITFDCTVEGTGADMADVLRQHDVLMAELYMRYPPEHNTAQKTNLSNPKDNKSIAQPS